MSRTKAKLAIILFNLCLLFLALIIPALSLASSESFYRKAFRECDTYSTIDSEGIEQRKIIYYVGGDKSKAVTLSDTQLDEVITHITDYISGKKESFELTLDRVYVIGGGLNNGVSLFGEEAISHMSDVRELLSFAKWTAVLCSLLLVFLTVIFAVKRKSVGKLLFKYSLRFYLILLFLGLVFILCALIGATEKIPFTLRLWKNLHYLIFPFQPGKVSASVLCDALTCILTTDFFMYALGCVFFISSSAVSIWLTTSFLIGKSARKI